MKKAFTLIELLIVVAIIAIIAAIAVPNFLDAQVRAKVSRVSSDMRSMATAIEAYCVDNNGYPLSVCPDESTTMDPATGSTLYKVLYPNGLATDSWIWYTKITTPISYITGIPLDAFAKPTGVSWVNPIGTTGIVSKTGPFHYYSGHSVPYATYSGSAAGLLIRRSFYALISPGPDLKLNTIVDKSDADCYLLYDPVLHGGGSSWYGRYYDPTNGTVSKGDIYRIQAPKTVLAIPADETSNPLTLN